MGKKDRIKKCSECEFKYEIFRTDQKFCSRRCRNRYNNRRYSQAKVDTYKTDAALHHNFKILQQLGEGVFDRSELLKLGFNGHYLTGINRDKKGKVVYIIYNLAYQYLSNNRVHITNH